MNTRKIAVLAVVLVMVCSATLIAATTFETQKESEQNPNPSGFLSDVKDNDGFGIHFNAVGQEGYDILRAATKTMNIKDFEYVSNDLGNLLNRISDNEKLLDFSKLSVTIDEELCSVDLTFDTCYRISSDGIGTLNAKGIVSGYLVDCYQRDDPYYEYKGFPEGVGALNYDKYAFTVNFNLISNIRNDLVESTELFVDISLNSDYYRNYDDKSGSEIIYTDFVQDVNDDTSIQIVSDLNITGPDTFTEIMQYLTDIDYQGSMVIESRSTLTCYENYNDGIYGNQISRSINTEVPAGLIAIIFAQYDLNLKEIEEVYGLIKTLMNSGIAYDTLYPLLQKMGVDMTVEEYEMIRSILYSHRLPAYSEFQPVLIKFGIDLDEATYTYLDSVLCCLDGDYSLESVNKVLAPSGLELTQVQYDLIKSIIDTREVPSYDALKAAIGEENMIYTEEQYRQICLLVHEGILPSYDVAEPLLTAIGAPVDQELYDNFAGMYNAIVRDPSYENVKPVFDMLGISVSESQYNLLVLVLKDYKTIGYNDVAPVLEEAGYPISEEDFNKLVQLFGEIRNGVTAELMGEICETLGLPIGDVQCAAILALIQEHKIPTYEDINPVFEMLGFQISKDMYDSICKELSILGSSPGYFSMELILESMGLFVSEGVYDGSISFADSLYDSLAKMKNDPEHTLYYLKWGDREIYPENMGTVRSIINKVVMPEEIKWVNTESSYDITITGFGKYYAVDSFVCDDENADVYVPGYIRVNEINDYADYVQDNLFFVLESDTAYLSGYTVPENGILTIPDTIEVDGKTYKVRVSSNFTFDDVNELHFDCEIYLNYLEDITEPSKIYISKFTNGYYGTPLNPEKYVFANQTDDFVFELYENRKEISILGYVHSFDEYKLSESYVIDGKKYSLRSVSNMFSTTVGCLDITDYDTSYIDYVNGVEIYRDGDKYYTDGYKFNSYRLLPVDSQGAVFERNSSTIVGFIKPLDTYVYSREESGYSNITISIRGQCSVGTLDLSEADYCTIDNISGVDKVILPDSYSVYDVHNAAVEVNGITFVSNPEYSADGLVAVKNGLILELKDSYISLIGSSERFDQYCLTDSVPILIIDLKYGPGFGVLDVSNYGRGLTVFNLGLVDRYVCSNIPHLDFAITLPGELVCNGITFQKNSDSMFDAKFVAVSDEGAIFDTNFNLLGFTKDIDYFEMSDYLLLGGVKYKISPGAVKIQTDFKVGELYSESEVKSLKGVHSIEFKYRQGISGVENTESLEKIYNLYENSISSLPELPNLKYVKFNENCNITLEDVKVLRDNGIECEIPALNARYDDESVVIETDIGSLSINDIINENVKSVVFKGRVGTIVYNSDSATVASNLTSIVFESYVGYIESYAFHDCLALESVTFNDGVGSLSGDAIKNCEKLKSLKINGTIGEIRKSYNVCDLSIIDFSDVESIGNIAYKSIQVSSDEKLGLFIPLAENISVDAFIIGSLNVEKKMPGIPTLYSNDVATYKLYKEDGTVKARVYSYSEGGIPSSVQYGETTVPVGHASITSSGWMFKDGIMTIPAGVSIDCSSDVWDSIVRVYNNSDRVICKGNPDENQYQTILDEDGKLLAVIGSGDLSYVIPAELNLEYRGAISEFIGKLNSLKLTSISVEPGNSYLKAVSIDGFSTLITTESLQDTDYTLVPSGTIVYVCGNNEAGVYTIPAFAVHFKYTDILGKVSDVKVERGNDVFSVHAYGNYNTLLRNGCFVILYGSGSNYEIPKEMTSGSPMNYLSEDVYVSINPENSRYATEAEGSFRTLIYDGKSIYVWRIDDKSNEYRTTASTAYLDFDVLKEKLGITSVVVNMGVTGITGTISEESPIANVSILGNPQADYLHIMKELDSFNVKESASDGTYERTVNGLTVQYLRHNLIYVGKTDGFNAGHAFVDVDVGTDAVNVESLKLDAISIPYGTIIDNCKSSAIINLNYHINTTHRVYTNGEHSVYSYCYPYMNILAMDGDKITVRFTAAPGHVFDDGSSSIEMTSSGSFSVTQKLIGYNVTYHTGTDVTSVSDRTVNCDTSLYNQTPLRAGYLFTGWYLDEGRTQEFVEGSRISEDLDLYASWMKQSLYVNGVLTPMDSDEFSYRTWFTDEECTKRYYGPMPENDTPLYTKEYKIVLTINCDGVVEKRTFTCGVDGLYVRDYLNRQYTWWLDEDGKSSVPYYIYEDTTVYGLKKQTSTLTIQYVYPTYSSSRSFDQTYCYEKYENRLNIYDLDGRYWVYYLGYYNDGYTQTIKVGDVPISDGVHYVTSPTTIQITYTPREIDITYIIDEDKGTIGQTYAAYYGETVSLPEVTAKDGYRFVGWISGFTITDSFTAYEPTTLYAGFVREGVSQHTITYDVDLSMGYCDREQTSRYDKDIVATLPEVTALEGYEFIGWTIDGKPVSLPFIIRDDVTIKAEFTKVPLKITFVSEGAEYYSDTMYVGDLIVLPEDPKKAGNEQYRYEFVGWEGYTEGMTVAGAHVFRAEFRQILMTYTVSFVVDGKVTDTVLEYGTVIDMPVPVKVADAQYTYVFTGWEGYAEGMTVVGNVTFTAKFDSVLNKYTVKFVNGDTAVYEEKLDYGTKIVTPTEIPRKESDAEYSYTFVGWEGYTEGMTVVGDVVFKAIFSTDGMVYKISFVNGDEVTSYDLGYGTKIVVPAKVPTKESDVQYSYEFKGWSGYAEGMIVTGDATFTAEFNSVLNKYTVKFVNGDEIIAESTLDYGTKIVAPTEIPTKESDVRFTYEFVGWEGFDGSATVTGNTVFKAVFKENDRIYDVEFKVDGKTVHKESLAYGKPFTAPSTATKEADAQYTYAFVKWDGFTEGMTVTGNMSFEAVFDKTLNEYTIKFVSEGKEIRSTVLKYGDRINAPVATVKESDVQYSYVFKGWSGYTNGMTVTGDATFTAEFDKTLRSYVVKFVSEGITILEKTQKYGSAITLPDAPAKKSDVQYSYVFKVWSGYVDGMTVTGDVTFTAEFDSILNKYTVRFVSDGETVSESILDYGSKITLPENPSKKADVQYTYAFIGWNGFKDDMTVTGDTVFEAQYSKTVNRYTATYVAEGKTVFTDEQDYGTSLKIPTVIPEKAPADGKTFAFVGWKDFDDGYIIHGDVIFDAVFAEGIQTKDDTKGTTTTVVSDSEKTTTTVFDKDGSSSTTESYVDKEFYNDGTKTVESSVAETVRNNLGEIVGTTTKVDTVETNDKGKFTKSEIIATDNEGNSRTSTSMTFESDDGRIKTSADMKTDPESADNAAEVKATVGTVSDSGKASVSDRDIDAALKQFEKIEDEIRKTQENMGHTGDVRIDRTVSVSVSGDADESLVAEIPASSMDAVASNNAGLSVKAAVGTITVDVSVASSLTSKAKENGDDTISLSISSVDKSGLSKAQKDVVKDNAVIQLKASVGNSPVHELGGKAVVTVSYELRQGESADRIVVWFVDDEGHFYKRVTAYDVETRTISFETDHFSYYVIAQEDSLGSPAENESNDYKLVIIGVVAAITVLSAAVLVFRRLQH